MKAALATVAMTLLFAGIFASQTGVAHEAGASPDEEADVVKDYVLKADDIKELAPGYGAAFVTDRITVEGLPVRFMYREAPDNSIDSGWRFMSGHNEDYDYMSDAANMDVMDVNTIANYDPTIIPFLDAPVGSVFEKVPGAKDFMPVTDWSPSQ